MGGNGKLKAEVAAQVQVRQRVDAVVNEATQLADLVCQDGKPRLNEIISDIRGYRPDSLLVVNCRVTYKGKPATAQFKLKVQVANIEAEPLGVMLSVAVRVRQWSSPTQFITIEGGEMTTFEFELPSGTVWSEKGITFSILGMADAMKLINHTHTND